MVALASMLAVGTNWPLVAAVDGKVPGGIVDPPNQIWAVAWGGHALLRQPLDLFQANAFWPLENSLAFSDSLLGYAPAGLIGVGAEAALVRYNVLYLFAYALAFAGAYLLGRALGLGVGASAAAGAAFAYAPWRLAHSAHLNILSSGGIPLSLFLLIAGYRSRRPLVALAGWLLATWQVSLGFNLGVPLLYLLMLLLALAAVHRLRKRRPLFDRQLAFVTAGGVATLLAAAALLARPYLEARADHPEALRTPYEVATFSPVPKSFLAAPEGNLLWGEATGRFRGALRFPVEQSLFPGVATVVLAFVGLASSSYPRALRLGLAIATAIAFVLSLGFHLSVGRLAYAFPYRWLYEFAPGFDGIRTPGRIHTLTSLGLALLAGAGAQRLISSRASRLKSATAAGVFALLLLEGVGSTPLARVPPVPPQQVGVPGPQLHLPTFGHQDTLYMYWSTEGFPAIVNGGSGFDPQSLTRLRRRVQAFPDRRSLAFLQSLGVRSVVLHSDLVRGTPWSQAGSRSIRELPVWRARRGKVILYRIGPT